MTSTVPGPVGQEARGDSGELARDNCRDGVAVMEIVEESPYRFVIPRHGRMRVPGVVFATRALLPDLAADRSLQQVVNVAELPGIVEASYAMPDVHWGYGFPIGGVAATDVANGGVVSPGGVGFDISCGVRLLVADLDSDELAPAAHQVMDGLSAAIPRGVGRGGVWRLRDRAEMEKVLLGGAAYAVQQGHGTGRDLERCEDHGAVGDADPAQVSSRAIDRGLHQVGSLGSGNHFLEVQAVDEIYDPVAAARFGLAPRQVCVMIHCGSRGLGHQICSDHVQIMDKAMSRYGITDARPAAGLRPRRFPGGPRLPGRDGRRRQLRAGEPPAAHRGDAPGLFPGGGRPAGSWSTTCPTTSPRSKPTRSAGSLPGCACTGRERPGRCPPATRTSRPSLAGAGQPVLIPGSMGTFSYVLAGVAGGGAFFSTCHGAGRVMSRHQAARSITGPQLRRQLEGHGIAVRGASSRGLAEETPAAYKDVTQVVAAAEGAGLCQKVARLVPLGVVKG